MRSPSKLYVYIYLSIQYVNDLFLENILYSVTDKVRQRMHATMKEVVYDGLYWSCILKVYIYLFE